MRYFTLEKIALIDGHVVIAILSNFMGDQEDGKPLGYLEDYAAQELSKKMEDPPFRLAGMESTMGAFCMQDPQQAFYKWRYQIYGPVPGREKVFEPISHLSAGSLPSIEEVGTLYLNEQANTGSQDAEVSNGITPLNGYRPV